MCQHCNSTMLGRRDVLRLAAGAGLVGMGVAASLGKASAASGEATKLTSDEALGALKAGNSRFVNEPEVCMRNLYERREEVAEHQAPWASVLSCADSRVPPELIFGGLALGELFVARNAGNLADKGVVGTLEYGAAVLGSPLVVVLAHTRCGAVDAACKVVTDNATYPGLIGPMINPIIPAALAVRDQPGDFVTNAAKESARRTAKGLGSLSTILSEAVNAGRVKIVSGIYDLASGEVTYLD
ncbi:MAG: carbonic anhydrase [Hyphomicrobiales bacterium]